MKEEIKFDDEKKIFIYFFNIILLYQCLFIVMYNY